MKLYLSTATQHEIGTIYFYLVNFIFLIYAH